MTMWKCKCGLREEPKRCRKETGSELGVGRGTRIALQEQSPDRPQEDAEHRSGERGIPGQDGPQALRSEKTHWRTGCGGKTESLRWAATSTLRRVLQEGRRRDRRRRRRPGDLPDAVPAVDRLPAQLRHQGDAPTGRVREQKLVQLLGHRRPPRVLLPRHHHALRLPTRSATRVPNEEVRVAFVRAFRPGEHRDQELQIEGGNAFPHRSVPGDPSGPPLDDELVLRGESGHWVQRASAGATLAGGRSDTARRIRYATTSSSISTRIPTPCA
jgi:hypothetical protein